MCNFRVGQKVVCIDAGDGRWSELRGCASADLVDGAIYTVTSIRKVPEAVFLRLQGVDSGWLSTRFRPVVERKTDISIFRAMLNATPETVGA